ncbi:hypothetical protein T440DRAFT_540974 [Plenodomus tracheiphilus IPT5]|uniref:Uncharacterized protein n=1 Tax=Plenodomus tracheiphilus IPT5 TaxID=1408161 RepID=A0A6A7AWN3_9PLEO|nr:hypothetical protein T440DRAFT_540974 [Plenodomus tracheiphilus IPT5]
MHNRHLSSLYANPRCVATPNRARRPSALQPASCHPADLNTTTSQTTAILSMPLTTIENTLATPSQTVALAPRETNLRCFISPHLGSAPLNHQICPPPTADPPQDPGTHNQNGTNNPNLHSQRFPQTQDALHIPNPHSTNTLAARTPRAQQVDQNKTFLLPRTLTTIHTAYPIAHPSSLSSRPLPESTYRTPSAEAWTQSCDTIGCSLSERSVSPYTTLPRESSRFETPLHERFDARYADNKAQEQNTRRDTRARLG